MSRPGYAPQGAQEARGTGYAVRGFLPAPFSPSPSPAHQCVARAADASSRGCGGRRCAPIAAGGTRFKSSSRGLPPRSPDSTPVCAISLSSSLDVGSPRSPSGIPVVATPVSHHRNFRRSATGGTGPDRSSGGDTPVIVLTRACGRVAPVTRGSDALARVFPDGARTRRTELFSAAFPRRTVWDTVGGPSAAPHRISRILSGTDVESIPPFI